LRWQELVPGDVYEITHTNVKGLKYECTCLVLGINKDLHEMTVMRVYIDGRQIIDAQARHDCCDIKNEQYVKIFLCADRKVPGVE
jgi:hypothetical protein